MKKEIKYHIIPTDVLNVDYDTFIDSFTCKYDLINQFIIRPLYKDDREQALYYEDNINEIKTLPSQIIEKYVNKDKIRNSKYLLKYEDGFEYLFYISKDGVLEEYEISEEDKDLISEKILEKLCEVLNLKNKNC